MSRRIAGVMAACYLAASPAVGVAEAATGIAVDCKPAVKADLFKPPGTPNPGSQAFPNQAVMAAVLLWIQQVTTRDGAAYADWNKAQSKATGSRECGSGVVTGDPDYCGWALGTPCRHRSVTTGSDAPLLRPAPMLRLTP